MHSNFFEAFVSKKTEILRVSKKQETRLMENNYEKTACEKLTPVVL